MTPGRSRRAGGGFTLIELIVVITIIGILSTIALPALRQVPVKAAEAVLKNDLRALRDVIDQYYADQGNYPPGLEALVEKGYLRKVPIDPITKSADTWQVVLEEIDPETQPAETDLPEGGQPGVVDVHSGSPALALDGTPYAEW
jgi:prepilin-type N-terminal cleavage/methylation domain-containing protein